MPQIRPASELSPTDGVYTSAEGAKFNAGLGAIKSSAIHNPFMTEALLTASIRQVKLEYGVTAAHSLPLQELLQLSGPRQLDLGGGVRGKRGLHPGQDLGGGAQRPTVLGVPPCPSPEGRQGRGDEREAGNDQGARCRQGHSSVSFSAGAGLVDIAARSDGSGASRAAPCASERRSADRTGRTATTPRPPGRRLRPRRGQSASRRARPRLHASPESDSLEVSRKCSPR